MGSCYSYEDELLWVSNAVADTINQECRRRLARFPASTARDELDEHLAYYEEMGSGLSGFNIEDEPLDDPAVRTLFAQCLSAFGADVFAAIRNEPHPEELDFLVTLAPYYQSSWLQDIETLHDMIRRSLRNRIEKLALPVDAEMRTAIEAHAAHNWLLGHRVPPYLLEDVTVRRTRLEKALAAPTYFDTEYVTKCFIELADAEEWIGELEAAAATTLHGAAFAPELAHLAEKRRRTAGFLREIWRLPDENGPREVYADWLSEQDDPRGEFIIRQIKGENPDDNPGIDPKWLGVVAHSVIDYPAWVGALAHVVIAYTFERGFLATCTIDANKLAATPTLWKHPAWATVRAFDLVGEEPCDEFRKHMRPRE